MRLAPKCGGHLDGDIWSSEIRRFKSTRCKKSFGIDSHTKQDVPLHRYPSARSTPWVRLAQECGGHLHDDHLKVAQLEEGITLGADTHRVLVCGYADDVYPCVAVEFGSDGSLGGKSRLENIGRLLWLLHRAFCVAFVT